MKAIPYCYSTEAENYITVPAMRQFLKNKGIETSAIITRASSLEKLEGYAKEKPEQEEQVLDWTDSLLYQGIVELHICSIDFSIQDKAILDNGTALGKLKEAAARENPHLSRQSLSEKFKIIKCVEHETRLGRTVSLTLCKTVYVLSKKESYALTFPVFIDIYIDKAMVIQRGKSKSTMYDYTPSPFSLERNGAIRLENLLSEALRTIRDIAGLDLHITKDKNHLKHRLYCLLNRYTSTPKEIEALIDQCKDSIQSMIEKLKNDICHLDPAYDDDITWDMRNLVEKYFSVSYPNKSIFTHDREAYPLKLVAKDDEDSKVEQTSALSEPLQAKAIFFDNKKMMQKSQCCEGICFMYQRKDTRYFSKQFKVSFTAKNNHFIIKFLEFTMEEDIQHVLFSLLEAE